MLDINNLQHISQIYIIINKEKENDRYIYLEDWFKKNNIKNYKYFEYCYKHNVKQEDIKKYYKEDKILYQKRMIHYVDENVFEDNYSKYKLSLSQISLAINHIKILEEVVKNEYENVLILESDAIFSDNFKHQWNNLYVKQVPKEWDIIILGSGNSYHTKEKMGNLLGVLFKNNQYIYENPISVMKCTEAMIFSLNACKKLIQTIIPFSAPIDHEYELQSLENDLKVYMCEPSLILNGTFINKYKTEIEYNKTNLYPTTFYSQIGQDKYYIENIISYKKDGVFLEIGAHDGITFSNTYYLEKNLNWKGICVEPNPKLYNKCVENRRSIVYNKAIFDRSNEQLSFIIPCGNQKVDGGLDQLGGLKGFIREKYIKSDFYYAYLEFEEIIVETININELLDQHKIFTIDYMSLDVEGYELNILKSIDYEKYKIKYITVHHGNEIEYQNQIQEFFESKNYIKHRNNLWDDEYLLIDIDKRKKVNSFDIFDTLLARKVKTPTDIFKIIESKYNIPNFYINRIRAEQLSNGYFNDIYNKYKQITNINDDNYINNLKDIEIYTEMENIIPIQSNIEKVKHDDIIISDMYLPLDKILSILKYIGVNKNVECYVTPNGKSKGYIWDLLKKTYNIQLHIGDNMHSDINMANNKGISTFYTQIHKYTLLENILIDELANILREFRLQNVYDESSVEYILYDEQCQCNIILLCLFAVQIKRILDVENRNKVLFTTRDCCLLKKIFSYLFPEYESVTYISSRILYKNYSELYKKYIKDIYNDKSIIIDLNGSFSSGRKVYLEVFNKLPRVHLLCYNQAMELYDDLTYSCLHRMDDYIEVLNSDTKGSAIYFYKNYLKKMHLFYFRMCENKIDYVNIIHETVDKFINYIEKRNLKYKFLGLLNATLFDSKTMDIIFSNKLFTYRYNDFLTNKV